MYFVFVTVDALVYLGYLIPKIWQILKHFSGAFRRAQTLKLLGVVELCR